MNVRLPYGKTELTLQLPDDQDVTVVEPVFTPGLPDPAAALRSALRQPVGSPPLRELAKSGQRVGIIFNDITRPTPNELILPALLDELDAHPRRADHPVQRPGHPPPQHGRRAARHAGRASWSTATASCRTTPSMRAPRCCLGTTRRGHEIWLNRELVAVRPVRS